MNKSRPDSEVVSQAEKAAELKNIEVTSLFGTIAQPDSSAQTTAPGVGNLGSVSERVAASQQPAQAAPASQSEPKTPPPQLTQKYPMPASEQMKPAAPAHQSPAESPIHLPDSDTLLSPSVPAGKMETQQPDASSGGGGVTQLLQHLWAPSVQTSSMPGRVSSSKAETPFPETIAQMEQRTPAPPVVPKPVVSRVIPEAVASSAPPGEFTRIIQDSAFRESIVAGRISQPVEPAPTSASGPAQLFVAATHLSIMMVIVIVLQVVIVLLLLLRH